MRVHSTLRRTLSLHFLILAILPALIFGLVAINLLHKHLQAGIYERNQQLSETIAASTDQFLAEVESDLVALGQVVEAEGPDRPEAIGQFLESVAYRSRRFESILLLDARHRTTSLGADPRMNLHREDYLGIDFSKHEIFQRDAVLDRPVWSNTFLSVVSGEPSITLALPVKQGTLLGNIRLNRLSKSLDLAAKGGVNYCAIVDQKGTLIAFSEPVQTAQQQTFKMHEIIGRNLHAVEGSTLQSHDGRLLLESTARVPRTGWIAWVGVDMGAEMAPVFHIRNLLIGILALALLAAAGVALFDARRLMLPLSALSAQARDIGSGQYDVQSRPSGFSEIDSLAASLRGMSLAIREREKSLVDSEQRFRDLVNSIDGVVWEMDVRSGDYLFVSERSAVMFGHPPQQWLDSPGFWSQHVYPEDLDRVVIRGRRSLALNEKHDLEYRFMTADGKPAWIRDLITVIWEGDEPSRLLGVMIDISDRKATETELERYRIDLEALVEQRTRELQATQKELVQKERLAVLGQLTATVSHEIRNPLGTVSNSLYLVRELLDSDCLGRIERPLTLAERSVQRCDGIISELLDFTRRRELQRQPLPLDEWLSGVLDEINCPESVHCRRQLDSGVTVFADPERLRRAMINVINNALQAMEEQDGERQLTVSTRRQADRCEIVVNDTGSGIPEELLEKIFEPLFSTKNFGVGLGVPIIRNIMLDHGGGVSYQSRVGEGTIVTLWLPIPDTAPLPVA